MKNLSRMVLQLTKSVRIPCFSGLHFPSFGLNTERYSVSLCIQSECAKMQTRITLNTDSFYSVHNIQNRKNLDKTWKQLNKDRTNDWIPQVSSTPAYFKRISFKNIGNWISQLNHKFQNFVFPLCDTSFDFQNGNSTYNK